MMAIALMLLPVLANMVYYLYPYYHGVVYWDLSSSGNHGRNGLGSNSIKATDRGAFLLLDNSGVLTPDSLTLPAIVSLYGWVLPTETTENRVFFRQEESSNSFHIGRRALTSCAFIYVEIGGIVTESDCPDNTFPALAWSFVVLSFDGTTFKIFMNTVLKVSLVKSFVSSATNAVTGMGTNPTSSIFAAKGVFWNFFVKSGYPNNLHNIVLTGSASCMSGTGGCSGCSVAIVDSYFGTGCVSTSTDSGKNSFGVACVGSAGCSKTFQYVCTSTTNSCGYDIFSHTCAQRMVTPTYNNMGAICTCMPGYVNAGTRCCNTDCSNCIWTGGCTACKSLNTNIVAGVCYCNSGYYGIPPLKTSNACCLLGSGCSTCTSNNPCTKCIDSNAYIAGGSCVCIDGYYSSSPGTCTFCNFGCKTCTSLDMCTSCWNTDMIESGDVCSCSLGYYFSAAKTCIACNQGCMECSSLDPCLTCWNNMVELSDTCSCPYGFYLQSQTVCLPCNTGCKTCSDIDLCLSCWDSNMIENASNICSCLDGFFGDTPMSCISCNPNCKTCTDVDFCTSCYDANMVEISDTCICPSGFSMFQPNSCTPCSLGCKTCTSFDTCSECWSQFMQLSGNLCSCISGYFLSDPKTCTSCNQGCDQCSSSDPCITCWDSRMIKKNGSCVCIEGYFQADPKSCKECSKNCNSCSSSEACLTCWNQYMVKSSENTCICIDGYFEDLTFTQPTCSKCKDECLTCDSYEKCTSCNLANSELFNGECLCKDGFSSLISSNGEKVCLSYLCPELCLSCLDLSTCTNCTENSKNVNGKCECISGYTIKNNSCQEKEFHGYSYIEKPNIIWIVFNETLNASLKQSDLIVHVDSVKVDFEIIQDKRKSIFGIKPKLSKIYKNSMIEVILRKDLKSKKKSILSTVLFKGLIGFSKEDIVEDEFSQKAKYSEKVAYSGMTIGLIITFLASMLSFDENSFFSFINTSELMYCFYLFNVKMNPVLREFLLGLRVQKTFPNIFNYFFSRTNGIELPLKLRKFGYKSHLTIINSGIWLSIIGLDLGLLGLACLVTLIPVLRNKVRSLPAWIVTRVILKTWTQSFFELILSSSVAVKYNINANDYQIGDSAVFFGTIVVETLMIFYLIKIVYTRCKINLNEELEEFDTKYGIFFRDLKADIKSSSFYLIFILRRIIIAIVSQTDLSGFIQIIIILSCNSFVLAYILITGCFKTKVLLIMNICSELFVTGVNITILIGICQEKLFTSEIFAEVCISLIYSFWGLTLILNFYIAASNIHKKLISVFKSIKSKHITNKIVPMGDENKKITTIN